MQGEAMLPADSGLLHCLHFEARGEDQHQQGLREQHGAVSGEGRAGG